VLSGLQQQERGRRFAIIDSDIFASAPYEQAFRNALLGHDAVFTGKPIWANAEYNRMPRGFQCMSGVYGTLWNNQVCGMTYCAVYDNDRLNECLREFQISLRPYGWKQLPARVQQLFRQQGLQVAHYDTAKVANLLLGISGASLANFDAPGLTHLGGISSVTLRDPQKTARRRKFLHLVYGLLPRFMRRLCALLGIHTHWRIYASRAENQSDLLKAWRRHSSCRYLARVLNELNGGAAVTEAYQHEDPRLVAEVQRVQQELTDLFAQNFGQNEVRASTDSSAGDLAVLANPLPAAWE